MHWDDTTPTDPQRKWSEWSMRTSKPAATTPRRLNNFASAFVLTISAVVMSGALNQLPI